MFLIRERALLQWSIVEGSTRNTFGDRSLDNRLFPSIVIRAEGSVWEGGRNKAFYSFFSKGPGQIGRENSPEGGGIAQDRGNRDAIMLKG